MHRLAARLEFGRKTEKVATDAIRLVQRMEKDWMTTGRRPSGICGACLILAARMNNFRRTVREVVYVVKVTDMTIQKRLEEFRVTPSSALTVEEFRTIDLTRGHDPPAFYQQQGMPASGPQQGSVPPPWAQQPGQMPMQGSYPGQAPHCIAGHPRVFRMLPERFAGFINS